MPRNELATSKRSNAAVLPGGLDSPSPTWSGEPPLVYSRSLAVECPRAVCPSKSISPAGSAVVQWCFQPKLLCLNTFGETSLRSRSRWSLDWLPKRVRANGDGWPYGRRPARARGCAGNKRTTNQRPRRLDCGSRGKLHRAMAMPCLSPAGGIDPTSRNGCRMFQPPASRRHEPAVRPGLASPCRTRIFGRRPRCAAPSVALSKANAERAPRPSGAPGQRGQDSTITSVSVVSTALGGCPSVGPRHTAE
jgi:hypothetical protein